MVRQKKTFFLCVYVAVCHKKNNQKWKKSIMLQPSAIRVWIWYSVTCLWCSSECLALYSEARYSSSSQFQYLVTTFEAGILRKKRNCTNENKTWRFACGQRFSFNNRSVYSMSKGGGGWCWRTLLIKTDMGVNFSNFCAPKTGNLRHMLAWSLVKKREPNLISNKNLVNLTRDKKNSEGQAYNLHIQKEAQKIRQENYVSISGTTCFTSLKDSPLIWVTIYNGSHCKYFSLFLLNQRAATALLFSIITLKSSRI